MLFVLNWFGDYRSLRFLCGYFGWRTFYFLLQKGCYSMEDRKKAFSVLGILVGVGMIIAGVSILISSNVEPSTVFLRDYFDEHAFNLGSYSTAYMAYQTTLICKALGWILTLLGMADIIYFAIKFFDADDFYLDVKRGYMRAEEKTEKKTEAPVKAVEIAGDKWICGGCQTENSSNYAQCKKCGRFRG